MWKQPCFVDFKHVATNVGSKHGTKATDSMKVLCYLRKLLRPRPSQSMYCVAGRAAGPLKPRHRSPSRTCLQMPTGQKLTITRTRRLSRLFPRRHPPSEPANSAVPWRVLRHSTHPHGYQPTSHTTVSVDGAQNPTLHLMAKVKGATACGFRVGTVSSQIRYRKLFISPPAHPVTL